MADQAPVFNRHRVTSKKQGSLLAVKGVSAGLAALLAIVVVVAGIAAYEFVIKQGGNIACKVVHCDSVPKLNTNALDQQNQNTARQLLNSNSSTGSSTSGSYGIFSGQPTNR